MSWVLKTNHIVLEGGKPRSVKKITMTRLASILGVNPYQSPFAAWCEITKIYSKPFVETKEIIAGRTIEPIVRDWLRDEVYGTNYILSPEEYYGNNWSSVSKKYDFYPNLKIFGGMWDTVLTRADKSSIKRIFEQKTTKRVEDWVKSAPIYYLVQGLGYGYMEGIENVTLTGTFLEEKDYAHPELFKPSVDNTILYDYSVEKTRVLLPDGNLYTIEQCFKIAEDWWNAYVETGISPEFDLNKPCDSEIIKELSKSIAVEKNGLESTVNDYLKKTAELDTLKKEFGIYDLEKDIENIKEQIVKELKTQMKEEDTSIEYNDVKLSKNVRTMVDTEALKRDGLYDYYKKVSYSYTLKTK